MKSCYGKAKERRSSLYMTLINEHAIIENYQGIESYEVLYMNIYIVFTKE